jgi:pimeloyl-ACP methyl ester carboxylesterase
VIQRRDARRATVTELSDPPLPLTTRVVRTPDGTDLHVVVRGAGAPLVLVHGLSLTHDLWRYQLIDLADRFRVIAYDLRGHGQSTVGRDGIGPHQSAADLSTVLEQLDLHHAVVAGHSIGGTVLGQLCADHPDVVRERVAGIVFVDTFASAIAGEGWLRERFSPVLARITARSAGRRELATEDRIGVGTYLAARSPFGRRPNPEQIRFTITLGRATEPSVIAAATIANLTYDVRAQLRRTDVPALIVRGSADRLSTARSTEQLANALPNATTELLDGVGHLPMLEARGTFNEILADFAAHATTT